MIFDNFVPSYVESKREFDLVCSAKKWQSRDELKMCGCAGVWYSAAHMATSRTQFGHNAVDFIFSFLSSADSLVIPFTVP